MKCRLVLLVLLPTVLLCSTGCLHAVRQAREQKAEVAFAKLASRPPEQIAGFMDTRMEQGLALTSTQQPAIAAINLKYARQMQLLAASPDSVRSKGKALKQQAAAKEAEFKAVLTPEQFTRYQEMREEMREELKSMAGSQAQ